MAAYCQTQEAKLSGSTHLLQETEIRGSRKRMYANPGVFVPVVLRLESNSIIYVSGIAKLWLTVI